MLLLQYVMFECGNASEEIICDTPRAFITSLELYLHKRCNMNKRIFTTLLQRLNCLTYKIDQRTLQGVDF